MKSILIESKVVNYFILNKIFFVVFFSICFFHFSVNASSQMSKIDGSNQVVTIWQQPDPETSYLQIYGSYGNDNPISTVLTSQAKYHAFSPFLTTSRLETAQTRAVAIWKAYELASGNQFIQVAIASVKGWLLESVSTISSEAEFPNNDYTITISDDGNVITASWSATIEDKTLMRMATSMDGGATWDMKQ